MSIHAEVLVLCDCVSEHRKVANKASGDYDESVCDIELLRDPRHDYVLLGIVVHSRLMLLSIFSYSRKPTRVSVY